MDYSKLFHIGLVDTDVAARLRHEVYCEERKFLPISPTGLETDQFDDQSLHCMLSAPDGDPIGYIRLIFPDHNQPLPFEIAAKLDGIDHANMVEASRLAVRKPYRFPNGEASTHLVLPALYMGCLAIAQQFKIENLFFITEKRIANHFTRRGADLIQIGNPVEYHGVRAPYRMPVSPLFSKIDATMQSLLVWARKNLEKDLTGAVL